MQDPKDKLDAFSRAVPLFSNLPETYVTYVTLMLILAALYCALDSALTAAGRMYLSASMLVALVALPSHQTEWQQALGHISSIKTLRCSTAQRSEC